MHDGNLLHSNFVSCCAHFPHVFFDQIFKLAIISSPGHKAKHIHNSNAGILVIIGVVAKKGFWHMHICRTV